MSSQSTQIIGPGKDTGARTVVEVDEPTNALVVTNAGGVAFIVQRGIAFLVTRMVEDATGVAQDQILIQTGALPVNLTIGVVSENDARIILSEGTTFSAAGTALTAQNRNRESALVAASTWTHTPTVTLAGTELARWAVLAREKTSQEFILAANTDYLLSLEQYSQVTATDVAWELCFYEPDLDA